MRLAIVEIFESTEYRYSFHLGVPLHTPPSFDPVLNGTKFTSKWARYQYPVILAHPKDGEILGHPLIKLKILDEYPHFNEYIFIRKSLLLFNEPLKSK